MKTADVWEKHVAIIIRVEENFRQEISKKQRLNKAVSFWFLA
jgi:hypothetical protein